MTTVDVRKAVRDITKYRHDAESAHSREDTLYEALLRSIADGTCENPKECARLALVSKTLEFPRWCASTPQVADTYPQVINKVLT